VGGYSRWAVTIVGVPMKKLSRIVGAVLFACLFPAFASAQVFADLRIEKFSVYSTLPERDGFRRVSVSFRIVNRGMSSAKSSTTRVIFDNSGTDFATPGLKPPPGAGTSGPTPPGAGTSGLTPPDVEAAYITHSIRTLATQVAITVVADALNVVPENSKTNNRLQFTAILNVQAGRWRSIGPSKIQDASGTFGPTLGVGRVTTIAVDSRLPTRIYLGARGSGLWKSSDDGATWFPIGDSLPSAQIDAIGIYPNDKDRVVVATPSGVFESRDGGSVWSLLTSEDLKAVGSGGGALLIANKINPPLYVSTKSGLRISTDGGRTWPTVRLPQAPASRVISLQFSTTDPSHLFASTANPPGVFEAKDGGLKSASWHILLGCVAPLPSFPPTSTVWIAESRGRRWVSFRAKTDTGNKAELWRSTNRICEINGFTEHSWEKVPLGDTCGTFGNNFSYLFAHPTDPSIVFKGGQDLCRSSRSGSDLAPVSGIHVDHHAIVATPSGMMFFGTDGGIYRSRDKGKTMEFLSEGLNNTEFLKIDTDGKGPRFVVGGSHDNFTSTWNGLSPVWNAVSGGNTLLTDSSLVAFDRADMTGIYEIAQSTRQVRLLKPGGGSVKLGDSSLPDCLSYSESSASVFISLVSTGGNPRLVITCQGIWSGPPWRRIQPSPSGNGDFKRLKLHPSGILVAVTDTGRVFFGRFNQPPLAEVFHTPLPAAPTAITFDQLNRFYVSTNVSSAGTVLGSIHRLECFFSCIPEDVWTNAPGEITAITIDPLAPNTLLAAVRNQGVFRGIRNAPNNWTWTEYNNGLPFAVTVTDLEPQSNGGIIAATYGRGAFQLFSRIVERTPPQKARGFVTSYEAERADPDRPAGPNNQVSETIEIDSRPGFSFTATSPLGRFRLIVQRAMQNKRIVTIEFTPIGPQSGKIISVK